MACYAPLQAWRRGGAVVFAIPGEKYGDFQVPCGKCIGCKLQRSLEMAARCMHENQMHEESSFCTLTYRDNDQITLNYKHYQNFMRKIRTVRSTVRFFMCGEYGDKYRRPHYHTILFGLRWEDMKKWKKSPTGEQLYQSDLLNALWGHGDCLIGNVTFETAAYIGRYCVKKITGDPAKDHYTVITRYGEMVEIEPEFSHMSLKPGLGEKWFKKYKTEVANWDQIIVNGKKVKPPRYYDKLLDKSDGFRWEEIQYERYLDAIKYADDNTPDRLAIREEVQQSKLKSLKRNLE